MRPRGEVERARKELIEYERANGDLTPATRRLLALSWLGSKYGRRVMETVLGQRLPRTPFRDSAWRWWTCLRLSELSGKWDEFSKLAQTQGLRKAMQWLKAHTTPDQLELFKRRAGQDLHDTGYRAPKGRFIWTKGGQWATHMPMTKLLVLKQHLPPRRKWKRWQWRLGDEGVRRLEKELMCLINPDVTFPHEAKWTAVRYVRRRIAEMINASYHEAGQQAAAWFFTQTLPTEDGRGYIRFWPDGRTNKYSDPTGQTHKVWDW